MIKIKGFLIKFRENIGIIDVVVCVILAFLFSISPLYQKNLEYRFSLNSNLILNFIMYFILFLILASIARILLQKFLLNKEWKKLDFLFESKYSIVIISVFFLICWLPILVGLYPGSLNNDGWNQITQFVDKIFVDHHPVFDTIIIAGSICTLSKIYNGNWQLALFTYTLIQSIIFSFVLAYTLIYSKKNLELNNKVLFICLVIYGLFPLFPCTIQAISKDTLFSWIYILFFVNFLEIVRTNGECLSSPKRLICTIILSIMCSLTKKVGMYVVVASFIILLITNIKFWKIILLNIVVVLCFMTLLMNSLFTLFDIRQGGKQEKYSLLFQQTARFAKYYGDDTSEDEKKKIDNVLGYNTLATRYNPINADRVKGYTQIGSNSDYSKWLKVWIKQGLRHPDAYIEATFAMLSGWFSWNEYRPLMNMDWHDHLNPYVIPESVTERTYNLKVANFIQDKYNDLANIPVFNIILSFGFIASIIPAFALGTCIKYRKNDKNIKMWVGCFPTIISIILGCWCGPVSEITEGVRYLYPIVFTNILLLLWTMYCIKEKEEE